MAWPRYMYLSSSLNTHSLSKVKSYPPSVLRHVSISHLLLSSAGVLLCQFQPLKTGDGRRRFELHIKRVVEPVRLVKHYEGRLSLPQPGDSLRYTEEAMGEETKENVSALPKLIWRLARWQHTKGQWASGWTWTEYVVSSSLLVSRSADAESLT